MKYNQPYGIADEVVEGDAPYINGDPSIGRAGSIPPAAAIELPQRELVHVIQDGGLVPSNSDTRQLGRAIQGGNLNYEVDTGTANAYACNMSPAPLAYGTGGLFVVLKIAHDNTGASVLNLNSLGNKNIVHRDGSAIAGGELLTGALTAFYYDGTNFQMVWSSSTVAGAPVFLTAARVFYVNGSTGNDSWDGTASSHGAGVTGPFATLGRACTEVAKYNLNGFDITVNIADGTYAARVAMPAVSGAGNVFWVGNVTTPANVIISSAEDVTIGVAGVAHRIKGIKVTNSVGIGIAVSGQGLLHVEKINFGACKGPQLACLYGSTLRLDDGPFTISGSASSGGALPGCFLYAYQGATVEISGVSSPPAIVLTGTPNFAGAFAMADFLSTIYLFFSSITGSATGSRYNSQRNSVIYSNGGATYYPGDSAGTATTGQYA